MNNKWIGMSFNNGNIYPLFEIKDDVQMKRNLAISEVTAADIYLIDEKGTTYEKVGHISFPQGFQSGKVKVTYQPENKTGEVELTGTDYIWSYTIETMQETTKVSPKASTIDKEEVKRRRQQKKEVKRIYADEFFEKMKQRVFGQEEPLRKMSEIIVRQLNMKNPKLMVLALIGHNGCGKSTAVKEAANVLTELTGVEYGYIKKPLNQISGEHDFASTIGSSAGYVGYGDKTDLDEVTKRPCVIELSEFDKAPQGYFEKWMEIFDTGEIRLANNSRTLDLNESVVVLTGNILVDQEEYRKAGSFQQKEMARNALTSHFGKPEIAARINCVVYQPLTEDARIEIIEKFVLEEMEDFDAIVDDIDSDFVEDLLEEETIYGARAVREMVRDALSKYTVYDRDIERFCNKHVRLVGNARDLKIEICEP